MDTAITIYFVLTTKSPLTTLDRNNKAHLESHLAGSIWKHKGQYRDENIKYLEPFRDVKNTVGQIQFDNSNFVKVSRHHLQFILSIKSENRLKVVKEERWLSEIGTIKVGDIVLLAGFEQFKKVLNVTVRFIGSLENKEGIWFGVQLPESESGKGSTDGTYRGLKLFSCEDNCGLFVNAYRIRSQSMVIGTHLKGYHRAMSDVQSQVGARVRWIQESTTKGQVKSYEGTLKWEGHIGKIPYRMAGVCFDEAIGKGNGKVKGQQLFECTLAHALVLPCDALQFV